MQKGLLATRTLFVLTAVALALSLVIVREAFTWGVLDFGAAVLIGISPVNVVAPITTGVTALIVQRFTEPSFSQYLSSTKRAQGFRARAVGTPLLAMLICLCVGSVTALIMYERLPGDYVLALEWIALAWVNTFSVWIFAAGVGAFCGVAFRNPVAPYLAALAFWAFSVSNIEGLSAVTNVAGISTGDTAGMTVSPIATISRLALALLTTLMLGSILMGPRKYVGTITGWGIACALVIGGAAYAGLQDDIVPDARSKSDVCQTLEQGLTICALPEHQDRAIEASQSLWMVMTALERLELIEDAETTTFRELTPAQGQALVEASSRSLQERLTSFHLPPPGMLQLDNVVAAVMFPPDCFRNGSELDNEERIAVLDYISSPKDDEALRRRVQDYVARSAMCGNP